jgi:hypothetical protein
VRVASGHSCRRPVPHKLTVGVVHEEERLRILKQVARCDLLAIAAEVGGFQGVVVYHIEEAVGPPRYRM